MEAVRLFIGYAGWGPGQLESELEAGAWIVADAATDDAFASDPSRLWRTVLGTPARSGAVAGHVPGRPVRQLTPRAAPQVRVAECDPCPESSLPVEHLFTLTATTAMSGFIQNGPSGTRLIVNASPATFEGAKLRGTTKDPGGDWVTMRADGSMALDVRLLLETDDGAVILMTYKGVGVDGGKTLRTAPLFETSDERYAWLNNVQGVATGGTIEGGVRYEVYQLL